LRSIILGIDSSDEFLSVGLARTDGVIISRATEPDAKNKNVLHKFISDVLSEANVKMEEIEGVGLAIGPGSFTGLRVGLAVAKGICWSLGLPLMGVSSLLAIAHCANKDRNRIITIKDARREEFYYAAFEKVEGKIKQAIPDSVGPAVDIFEIISKGFKAIGPGITELNKYPKGIEIGLDEGYDRQGLGGMIALLGRRKLNEGDTLEVASAAPVYIRTPRPKEWKP
jgi:tRNA threonylcarbamoyladenosine biosynthesis protein TsaB